MNTAPLAQKERISIIDSVRGIALLGILMMNVPFQGNAYQAHLNINVFQEFSGPNLWCWWVINLFFEGTMRGLFSMLFGEGALLLIGRLEKNPPEGLTPADIYYRRLIWLLVFGLINAYIFLWPGDILYAYALCGLFLYPFRNLKPHFLIGFSVLFLVFSTLQHSFKLWNLAEKREKGEAAMVLQAKHKQLTENQKSDLEDWKEYKEEQNLDHIRKKAKKEIESMNGTYPQIFEKMKEVNGEIETKEMYYEYFFDALSFFMLGMALFRLGFIGGEQSIKNYALMALAGYGFGLTVNYFWLRQFIITGFDFSITSSYYPFSVYQFKRVCLALGHLGLVMVVFKLQIVPFLFRWLAKVGQMAFSNYLMQSIFAAIFFHGYALGYFGKLQRFQLYEYVVFVWIFQIFFSQIWLYFFQFGPFEWLWRSLTYWKRQPFLRTNNQSQV